MAFAFNTEKDEILKKFRQKTFGLTRLRLTAHSYDGGEPKLQITRQRRNKEEDEEWKFAKLGRMNFQELSWLGRVVKKEATPWFEKYLEKHPQEEEEEE